MYDFKVGDYVVTVEFARLANLRAGDKLALRDENGSLVLMPIVRLLNNGDPMVVRAYGVEVGDDRRRMFIRQGDSVAFVRAPAPPLTEVERLEKAIQALRELSSNTVARDALRQIGVED